MSASGWPDSKGEVMMENPVKKRKSKGKSPTSRATEILRKEGFTFGIVERKVPYQFISQDFLGFADLIYLTKASIVAVQVTTGSNHAARRTKILAEPRALAWIKSGGLIEIWSFALQGGSGKAKRWVLRKEEIVEGDFA